MPKQRPPFPQQQSVLLARAAGQRKHERLATILSFRADTERIPPVLLARLSCGHEAPWPLLVPSWERDAVEQTIRETVANRTARYAGKLQVCPICSNARRRGKGKGRGRPEEEDTKATGERQEEQP